MPSTYPTPCQHAFDKENMPISLTESSASTPKTRIHNGTDKKNIVIAFTGTNKGPSVDDDLLKDFGFKLQLNWDCLHGMSQVNTSFCI